MKEKETEADKGNEVMGEMGGRSKENQYFVFLEGQDI